MAFTRKDLLPFARGDTWTTKFTITDSNKAPIDITGLTFWMTLKDDKGEADPGDAQISAVAGSPDSNLGIVFITFPKATTATLTPDTTYNYDLQQVDNSVSPCVVSTLLIGKVRVARDITVST